MKHKTVFRLALRLIGVFLIAQTAPWVLVSCGELAITYTLTGSLGSSLGPGMWPLDYTITHLLTVVVGLYLFFGGKWIINRVIPSNRPYCPECGYEITGLPPDGICPECGTAYKQAVRPPAP